MFKIVWRVKYPVPQPAPLIAQIPANGAFGHQISGHLLDWASSGGGTIVGLLHLVMTET